MRSSCKRVGVFLLWAKLVPRGYVGKELISFILVVNLAAVMLHPVANNKPSNPHLYVVSTYLVEYSLADGNMRGLVFNYHNGASLSIIDNRIATLLGIVQIQCNFVGYTRCVKALLIDKEMNEVLADPLFGCKNNVFFA